MKALAGCEDGFEILINAAHIDFMGHVNNAEYLRWAQNVVLTYWYRNAPPDAVSELAWVATEHTIRYYRPAHLHDKLKTTFSVVSVKGCRAIFLVQFTCGDIGIAEIKSTWCCVQSAQNRPTRVPPNVLAQFNQTVGIG
jgi:acyl-CoA thioester hydrolase